MTVNSKKRGRPAGTSLSRDSILEAAQALMFSEQKKLSIRGVAKQLSVDPMAIYHYFSNKSALLQAVTVAVMQQLYQPQPGAAWQDELMALCRSYLVLLRDHPDLLETLLSMGDDVGAPAQVFAARFEQATGLEAAAEAIQPALDLLVDYLHGFALAQQCNAELPVEASEGPLRLYFGLLPL